MAQGTGVPTLEEAMVEIGEAAQGFALTEGITSPILHCFAEDGVLTVAHLVGEPGAGLGRMVQLAIAAMDPAVVILASQAWATLVKPGQAPTAGNKRPHILILMGEDRTGNQLTRAWYIIEPTGRGQKRTLQPMNMDGATNLGGNFHPLFIFRKYMKAGCNEKVARAMAKKEAEAAGGFDVVPGFTSGIQH